MSKVLIAGGAGFIGSHLTKNFIQDGHEVYVYDNNIQYFFPLSQYSIYNMKYRHEVLLKGAKLVRGNTLDINDLRRNILNIQPEYIVNLAALPLAVTAVKNTEEAFSSILYSTHNFMEIMRDCDFIKKYVHISSSMVYGDFKTIPNPENALKEPKEIYGSMKLSSEYIVKGYAQRFNINSVIIRPSAVYGPTDNNYRVIQKFIESALAGKEIVANNPSSNTLDFSYVKDVAQGMKQATLGNTLSCEAFNLTNGEGRTLKEAIDILQSHFKNLKVIINENKDFYPKRGSLDISKAKKIIGFKPIYTLEKGILEYLSFLKN